MKSAQQSGNTSATDPDRRNTDRTGRADGGTDVTEISFKVAQVTRSAAKQTPEGSTSFLSKKPILSPTKGSSSKRPKK